MALGLFFVVTVVPACSEDTPPEVRSDYAHQVKERIVALTNRFRQHNDRSKLKPDPQLAKAAQAFAIFLARTDQFSHEADDKTPAERVQAAGYRYCIVAENIALESNPAGFTTEGLATSLMEGWKKSPPHRKNLLDPDLDEIGVGLAQSAKTGKYYAVQDFGRPKSKGIEFQLANETDVTIEYTLNGQSHALKPQYSATLRSCTTPTLKLLPRSADNPASAEPAAEVRPANRARYVVRKDANGAVKIEKE